MEICGIDPGLETTGYAVVHLDGERVSVRDAGVLTTNPRLPLPQRLVELADGFAELLDQWHPFAVGVEELYAHYKHPRTAIRMGHARGVLLAAAHRSGASIHSFNATRIKKYLTGNGRAAKRQVQHAVQSVYNLDVIPEPDDVADALAIAFCLAGELAVGAMECRR